MSDLIYSPQVLPINSAHVALQFARRQDLSEARFILDEIALRMLERLQYIKLMLAVALVCATRVYMNATPRRTISAWIVA